MIFTLLLLASFSFSSPYPSGPFSLQGLIEVRSDVIVYGELVDTKVIDSEDDHFAEVTIEVEEEG